MEKKIIINAPAREVWNALTNVQAMKKWMGDPAMELEILTTWETGSPIIIKGFHHTRFENKGTVLEYTVDQVVSYDFLSSVSRLPDTKENHTVLRFILTPDENSTTLALIISNFPTETIYQHLNFYWNGTLMLLKKHVENGSHP